MKNKLTQKLTLNKENIYQFQSNIKGGAKKTKTKGELETNFGCSCTCGCGSR